MLIYSQSTGRLVNEVQQLIATGYSGHGVGRNNPDMESVRNVGPLPCGFYTMTEIFDSSTHGPNCIRLQPDDPSKMFGRDGMLCHGDSIEHPGLASEGCLIMPPRIRVEVMWHQSDHRLEVVR